MLFREYFGYEYLTWPTELIGALRIKFANGFDYVLSVDEKDQAMQKKYISLYPNISKIVKDTVKKYIEKNSEKMEKLKEVYESSKTSLVRPIIQKSPGVEDVVQYICDATSAVSTNELVAFYETTTATTRKTKAKILAPIMWDFWILHECADFTYEEFKEKIIGNRWDIEGKKQLIEKNYEVAMPYLTRCYDPRIGVLKKYFSEAIILDCIVLVMKIFDEVCKFHQIDSTELLLGKWHTKKWKIYDIDTKVDNKVGHEITINLDDVEIYKYTPLSVATIETYDTNEVVQGFVSWIMKSIDNELRGYTDYKSMLGVSEIEEIITDKMYQPCISTLPQIIREVVKFVVENNNPKKINDNKRTCITRICMQKAYLQTNTIW